MTKPRFYSSWILAGCQLKKAMQAGRQAGFTKIHKPKYPKLGINYNLQKPASQPASQKGLSLRFLLALTATTKIPLVVGG
jgi:hypothetical protein